MKNDPRYDPHAVLAPHYRHQTDKQPFLRRIFDDSAEYYERIATWGFLGTGDWYRRQALKRAGLAPGMQVVDVAAGTGITARAAALLAGGLQFVTCIEPSLGMLRQSERRLTARHIQGAAEYLPVRDGTFDFLTMGFALRHVGNLEAAFREFRRVLKPGGRLLIMDMTKPEGRIGSLLVRFYFRDFLPRLTRLLTGSGQATYLMQYYWDTVNGMVDPQQVLEALAMAGLDQPRRHVEAKIFSEYTARKP